jgi:hypothetical protein
MAYTLLYNHKTNQLKELKTKYITGVTDKLYRVL